MQALPAPLWRQIAQPIQHSGLLRLLERTPIMPASIRPVSTMEWISVIAWIMASQGMGWDQQTAIDYFSFVDNPYDNDQPKMDFLPLTGNTLLRFDDMVSDGFKRFGLVCCK